MSEQQAQLTIRDLKGSRDSIANPRRVYKGSVDDIVFLANLINSKPHTFSVAVSYPTQGKNGA